MSDTIQMPVSQINNDAHSLTFRVLLAYCQDPCSSVLELVARFRSNHNSIRAARRNLMLRGALKKGCIIDADGEPKYTYTPT